VAAYCEEIRMLIQSEIPADPEIVFDSIVKVVQILGYSVKKSDRSGNTIDVRVPLNWGSYGEKLTFKVEALNSGMSLLQVDAKRAVISNLTSHPDIIARRIIGYVEKECSGVSWIQEYWQQRPISVKEVISKSATLIVQKPALVLPALPFGLILAAVTGAEIALFGQPTTAAAPLLTVQGVTDATLMSIVLGVLLVLVIAPYPQIVQGQLRGGTFSVSESLRMMLQRFRPLLLVGILIGLMEAALTIVPPILVVFALLLLYPWLWYTYTIPAMMLENAGVRKAMKVSKAFGRDRKSSTLGLYLVLAIPGIVILVIISLLSRISSALGQTAEPVLDIPMLALFGIAISYTYLTYGPSVPVPASTMEGSSSLAPSLSNRYCAHCGTLLAPKARFCSNCGERSAV
jgi:hypothetical protein